MRETRSESSMLLSCDYGVIDSLDLGRSEEKLKTPMAIVSIPKLVGQGPHVLD